MGKATNAWICVLLLSALVQICGCSDPRSSGDQRSIDPGSQSSVSVLPVPDMLERRSSAVQSEFSISGIQTFDRRGETSEEGSYLRLGPSEAMAYAIYGFDLAATLPSSIDVRFEGSAEAYIAVANYGKLRWDMVGYIEQSLTIPLTEDHVSESNHVFVAIIIFGSAIATVSGLEFQPRTWEALLSPDPSPGVVGMYSSMAVVAGNPAIAYYDASNDDLKYVRANSPDGDNWDAPVVLDSDGSVGWYASLAIINGNPAVSYWDASNFTIKYIHSGDTMGTAGTWSEPATLAPGLSAAQYTSLTQIEYRPGIAFQDHTTSDLMFIRANDADGTSWPISPQTVDVETGYYPSLAEVNGNPAISYYDISTYALKYKRAAGSSGFGWGPAQVLDDMGAAGGQSCLRVVHGTPAIAYHVSPDGFGDLKYIRSFHPEGQPGHWGTPVTVDAPGSIGSYPYLGIVNDHPAISYYDTGNQAFKYARSVDRSGIAWELPQVLDADGSVGKYSSMVTTEGGLTLIEYFNETQGSLQLIRLR